MNIKELLKLRLSEEMNFYGDGYLIIERVLDEVFDTQELGNVPQAIDGMSLRDYFAVKAMQGLLNNFRYDENGYAQSAYKIADAMLKAREGIK